MCWPGLFLPMVERSRWLFPVWHSACARFLRHLVLMSIYVKVKVSHETLPGLEF